MKLRDRSGTRIRQAAACRKTSTRFLLLTLFLFAFITVGCGGAPDGPIKYPLTGTVTREGKPMEEGILEMVPTAGGPAAQAKITDGQYSFTEVTGPVEGEHVVTILRVLQKGPIPPGGTAKDADYLPETGFTSPMPSGGWVLHTTVSPDQDVSEPVNFNVDDAETAAAGGRRR